MKHPTPTKRVTVTLPSPLPLGIWCHVCFKDDDPDSTELSFIAFNLPPDGEYLTVFDLKDIEALFKRIDGGRESYDDDSGEWYIDLSEDYWFVFE